MRYIALSILFLNLYIFSADKKEHLLTIKLDPKGIHEHVLLTITDQNGVNIFNNKKLEPDKPLKLHVTSKGPYFITYLAAQDRTLDKHHSQGLGPINVEDKGSVYNICLDTQENPVCSNTQGIRSDDWPGVTLIQVNK